MAAGFLPRSYSGRLTLFLALHFIPIILFLPFILPHLILMVSHNSNIETHVQVDKISKALWDSDFKLVSLVIKQQFRHVLSTCDNINDSKGITVFVPSDDELYNFQMKYGGEVIELGYQILTEKFDKEAFDLGYPRQSFSLSTCNPTVNVTVTRSSNDRSKGFAARGSDIHGGFKITHWDIYNDGIVVVHGIGNFLMHHTHPYHR